MGEKTSAKVNLEILQEQTEEDIRKFWAEKITAMNGVSQEIKNAMISVLNGEVVTDQTKQILQSNKLTVRGIIAQVKPMAQSQFDSSGTIRRLGGEHAIGTGSQNKSIGRRKM